MRFEVDDGTTIDTRRVEIHNGNVIVSRDDTSAPADCSVKGTKSLLDRVASGDANAMAAVLRGELRLDGDATLLLQFQRLFPGPQRRTR
jgi:putative sterol carrier protein